MTVDAGADIADIRGLARVFLLGCNTDRRVHAELGEDQIHKYISTHYAVEVVPGIMQGLNHVGIDANVRALILAISGGEV